MSTIKDVAKKANVSVATVSRVINNTGYVNHETRQIVVDVIEELQYVPNELARSLFSKRSNIIGLIVPHISTFFFGELIEALEDAITQKGYKLMIFNSKDDIELEKKYINTLWDGLSKYCERDTYALWVLLQIIVKHNGAN